MRDNLQNKNFKMSIGFFSLQDKPALLIPWIVYNVVFVFGNTCFLFFYVQSNFAVNDIATGVVSIVVALIYFGK